MKLLIYIQLFLFLVACVKSENKKISLLDGEIQINILSDRVELYAVELKNLSDNNLQINWSINSDSIVINKINNYAYFILPELEFTKKVMISLILKNGISQTIKQKEIELKPSSNNNKRWGLGNIICDKIDNIQYYCYYDQGNTGTFSDINCGPAVATMAIKWCDKFFNKKPIDARNTYRKNGGWWYVSDIQNYLRNNNVNSVIYKIKEKESIIKSLRKGNIVILCLDAYYLSEEKISTYRIDKFYKTNFRKSGHFILVKGYRKTEKNEYFDVYDPFSMGIHYDDGTLKGSSRFYNVEDVIDACSVWWDNYISISKNKLKLLNNLKIGVDIDDAWGK